MKYLLAIALILCQVSYSETLVKRVEQLTKINFVEFAKVVTPVTAVDSSDGKVQKATITFSWREGDIMYEDSIEVRITGYETDTEKAYWYGRLPKPIQLREEALAAATPAVASDEEILAAITAAQGVAIGKADIDRNKTYANVSAYVELEGKWVRKLYYVAKNIKDNTWVIKETLE